MDLNTIDAVARPRVRGDFPAWRAGDAYLAGGTWLFSEPQPQLSRLIDLGGARLGAAARHRLGPGDRRHLQDRPA